MNSSMGQSQSQTKKKTAAPNRAEQLAQPRTSTTPLLRMRSSAPGANLAKSSASSKRVVSPPMTASHEAEARAPSLEALAATMTAPSPNPTAAQPDKYKTMEGDQALLGEGGYGVVLKAYDNHHGRHVAVKRVLLDRGDLKEEYGLLKQLPHPNIVSVYDFWCGTDGAYADMYMEWVSEGSLKKVIRAQGKRLYEVLIRKFARQTLLALEHLHKNGIVHRDVKPDNLLITSTGTVKLSDMGISVPFLPCKTLSLEGEISQQSPSACEEPKRISQAGTLNYMSPECLQNGTSEIGPAADIWAWACTVCEMGSRRLPWHEAGIKVTEPFKLMLHIVNAKPPNHHPTIPQTLSHTLQSLLLKCFDLTPAKRPTPTELLEAPYFCFVDGIDNATGLDADEEAIDKLVVEMGMENIDDYDASEDVLIADY